MARRNQIIVLGVLVLMLVAILYRQWQRPAAATQNATVVVAQNYPPINVENPSLRKDLLEKIHSRVYPPGHHRNIFSDQPSAPPPPPPQPVAQNTEPPPPPPLVIPATFFGVVADAGTGFRRAFFASGEDVFIIAEGETLMQRFRLLRITSHTAELEEIVSGRRTTVALEETAPPA